MSLLDAWIAGWWRWLFSSGLQAFALAALVFGLERALGRRARPSLRALLWSLVLLRLVLPPAARLPAAAAAALPEPVTRWVHTPAHFDDVGASVRLLVFGVWLVGVLVGAALWIARERRARRGAAKAMPVHRAHRSARDLALAARALGLARPPALVLRVDLAGPRVEGVLRPRIALPSDFADLPASARRAALLHELAHVRRRDPLRHRALFVVQLLAWFHPAAWLAARRLRTLAELACDGHAARALEGGAAAYERALARFVQPLVEPPRVRSGALLHPGLLGGRAEIVQRLEGLRAPAVGRCVRALEPLIAALVLCACLFPARPAAPPFTRAWFEAALTSPTPLPGCLQRRTLLFGLLGADAKDASGEGAVSPRPDQPLKP